VYSHFASTLGTLGDKIDGLIEAILASHAKDSGWVAFP
jgi:hypothetical protein